MTSKNPIKDPAFQRTLKNLLSAPPKPHADMKVGKKVKPKKPTGRKKAT